MISTELAFHLAAALLAHSEDRDGHRVWIGDNGDRIRRHGADYSFRRAAHLVRTGYPPLGRVRTACGVAQCFTHLIDLGGIPTDPTTPDPRWSDRAACRDHDPDLFFPGDHPAADREAVETQAITVCLSCPVRAHCLADAFATPEQGGIRGGLTESQRQKERARRRAAARRAQQTTGANA